MSSVAVLKEIGAAIQQLLVEGLQGTDGLTQKVTASGAAPSDADVGVANGPHVSWWLYQVMEDEYTRNPPLGPPPKGTDKTKAGRFGPLVLNLYYLLTPYCGSTDADLLALGKAMQLLNDNSVLYVQTGTDSTELRISLLPCELEDRARLWEALRQTYRLSVCYQVRVARIDSERVASFSRVIEARSGVPANPPAPPG